MSFKSAIEKVKQMFANVDEQMQKQEEYLHTATNGADEIRIVIDNKTTPCVCVFITPGSDIDHVMEAYSKVGIKLHKHIFAQGHRRQNILYMKSSEYAKLDVKHQKYFKRTTSNHTIYKQNLTYTEKHERD